MGGGPGGAPRSLGQLDDELEELEVGGGPWVTPCLLGGFLSMFLSQPSMLGAVSSCLCLQGLRWLIDLVCKFVCGAVAPDCVPKTAAMTV